MHYAVIDLGYGDAGKGILTARLCATRDIDWVVRTSGGCQAAHNVVTDDGRHHTFAQFGSGTFAGVKTYLSKYMLVEPFSLLIEARALEDIGIVDPMRLVTIDPDALITTPYHWELNQWQEDQRGNGRHGSTGRGIGTTAWFASEFPDEAPRMGDILAPSTLRRKLGILARWCATLGCPPERLPSEGEVLSRYLGIVDELKIMRITWSRVLDTDQVVFEGAQGVLLDEDHGFFPNVTRSHTTDDNVHRFLEDAGRSDVPLTTIGVTRSYMTRHGAGPFVTEQDWPLFEQHNKAEHYQGGWRQGYLDLVALAYALDCVDVDYLYVTHTDAPKEFTSKAATAYAHYATGEQLKLEHIDPMDFAARESQSHDLTQVEPVLVPQDYYRVAESLSEALELPLFGKGWGPKISDGVIQQ